MRKEEFELVDQIRKQEFEKGVDYTADKISKALSKVFNCGRCPCQCEWGQDQTCEERIRLWVKRVVNE